jgi:hypothetical protein
MKHTFCRWCSKSFRDRPGKLYCSSQCRYQGWLSKQAVGTIATPCVYCGIPAETVDHVPPRSVRPYLADRCPGRFPLHEVHACQECNTALGARPLWTLAERKRFIKSWLARRYRRFLKQPTWAPEEIEELGHNLRTVVVKHQVLKELTVARIAW